MRFTVCFLFGAVVLAGNAARAQTPRTLYRETFGRATMDAFPDADALGNIPGNIFDWPTFRPTAAGGNALLQLMGNNASGVSGNAASGQPTDVVNVNAGLNADGTSGAYARGLYFMAQQEQGPKLAWTSEFTFNPANYTNLTFTWRQGNDNDAIPFQVAIRIGDQWYVNNTQFVTAGYPDGVGNFNASAQPQSFAYDAAAANWMTLDFNGTWDAALNTGVDSSVPFALVAAPLADLAGTIDGFGLYSPTNTGTRRFDTFEITGQRIPGSAGDFDSDADVDGEDFLRWQRGLSPTPLSPGDLDNWKNNFAKATAAVGAIPEPSAGLLALLAAAALAARRRSRIAD